MKHRWVLWVVGGILLIGSNLFWFLTYINMSLTIDSLSSDLHLLSQREDILASVCLDITKTTSRTELISVLKKAHPEDEIAQKDNSIQTLSGIQFDYSSGKLERISIPKER